MATGELFAWDLVERRVDRDAGAALPLALLVLAAGPRREHTRRQMASSRHRKGLRGYRAFFLEAGKGAGAVAGLRPRSLGDGLPDPEVLKLGRGFFIVRPGETDGFIYRSGPTGTPPVEAETDGVFRFEGARLLDRMAIADAPVEAVGDVGMWWPFFGTVVQHG